MTIERLELLSDDVLINLAKKIGVKVKPDWTRSTLIVSIVDVMAEDRIEKESLLNLAISIESKKYSVTINEEIDLSYDVDEEMLLPVRYNESSLHFLLRDNSWGFILWDIKDSQHLKYQKQLGEVSYILRIIELEEDVYDKEAIVDIFDIEIDRNESDRYINLPNEESYYCVEFILLSDSKEIIIERSKIMKTSRNHVNYILDNNEVLNNIVALSGFSTTEIAVKTHKSLNRILPMDSLEGEE